MNEQIRTFDTGASRNGDEDKPDYEGFLHPLVIQEFGAYMHRHRLLENGTFRASDNWTKGIPMDSAIKSGWRHFHDWCLEHRGYESREGLKDALCGLMFNVQSYLLSVLEAERQEEVDQYQYDNEPDATTGEPPSDRELAALRQANKDQQAAVDLSSQQPSSILQKLPWLKALSGKG